MTLIKIWSKRRGVIYDVTKDGAPAKKDNDAQEKKNFGLLVRPVNEQSAFGFLASMA